MFVPVLRSGILAWDTSPGGSFGVSRFISAPGLHRTSTTGRGPRPGQVCFPRSISLPKGALRGGGGEAAYRIDVNKGFWKMGQWKFILEFIPIVPAYFPSCCDSAAVPSDFSALSSESLGNPCACLAEFVASGVLQETPSSIHAPAVSTLQPLTVCTIFGLGAQLSLRTDCNYQYPLIWWWILAFLS